MGGVSSAWLTTCRMMTFSGKTFQSDTVSLKAPVEFQASFFNSYVCEFSSDDRTTKISSQNDRFCMMRFSFMGNTKRKREVKVSSRSIQPCRPCKWLWKRNWPGKKISFVVTLSTYYIKNKDGKDSCHGSVRLSTLGIVKVWLNTQTRMWIHGRHRPNLCVTKPLSPQHTFFTVFYFHEPAPGVVHTDSLSWPTWIPNANGSIVLRSVHLIGFTSRLFQCVR